MNNKRLFIGLDIGASHIKIVYLNGKLEPTLEVYPIWEYSIKRGMDRITIIGDIVKRVIEEKCRRNNVYVNTVTSIEAAYPSFDVLGFLKTLSRDRVRFYTINKNLNVISIDDIETWPNISVFYSLAYIARKLIDTGILIHMNSSSTIFVPIQSKKLVIKEVHYSCGTGVYLGALYTTVRMITNETFLFGKKSLISPTLAMILDILCEVNGSLLEDIMKKYAISNDAIEWYKSGSFSRLLKLHGFFPETKYKNPYTGTDFDLKNQINISSWYIYHKLLNLILENVIRILSETDIQLNGAEFILSGIGKYFILPDALYIFRDKITDIKEYIPEPYNIFLESFSAALSLYEYITNSKISLNEIKWREQE